MAFDGRDYLDPGWIYQRHTEPKHSADGAVFAAALEGAYYQARHGSKHLGCVMSGFNAQNNYRYASRAMISKRGAYVGVADFIFDIPSSATHIIAGVSFSAAGQQELTVSHRLTIQGTTGSDDVGAASSKIVPAQEGLSLQQGSAFKGRRRLPRNIQETNLAAEPEIAWCDVTLSNQLWSDGSANQVGCLAIVEVQLSTTSASTVVYRPGCVWLGYEVRD